MALTKCVFFLQRCSDSSNKRKTDRTEKYPPDKENRIPSSSLVYDIAHENTYGSIAEYSSTSQPFSAVTYNDNESNINRLSHSESEKSTSGTNLVESSDRSNYYSPSSGDSFPTFDPPVDQKPTQTPQTSGRTRLQAISKNIVLPVIFPFIFNRLLTGSTNWR